MKLDALHHLRGLVSEYLKEPEGTLDFFFDQVREYIVHEKEPRLPQMRLSSGRDFLYLLEQLDKNLRAREYTFEWFPYIKPKARDWLDSQPEHVERQVKVAFGKLEDTKLTGLFYFVVLCVIFYGGILDYDPEIFVEETFPMDTFDLLKPYIVAKKLEKEFTQEEIVTASMKSVTAGMEPINPAMIPPYATNSFVKLEDGNFYLVYDLLRDLK